MITSVWQLPVFLQICLVLGQFPGKHFLYLHGSCSACSHYVEGSGPSTLVDLENFLVFLLSFFFINFQQYFFLFPEIVNFSSNSKVLLYCRCCNLFKWQVYCRLNGFKFTRIFYCNCSSLMILIKDQDKDLDQGTFAFYLSFQLTRALLHCKYKPCKKSIDFYLFRHNCWLNHLSATK